MPYGIAGVMAGAAKCFFGFVGFDCVATTGEEAHNPQRNIPLSIVLSLIIIFLSYFGVSAVLTLMWPYYLQDPVAPFPHVFGAIGWIEVKWIVTIGAILALCTSLLGAMFPLPRVLYAMASDGLVFRGLRRINERTQTPLLATICAGLLSGTMALLFDLHQLIDMMSIGTLLAYTIVAVCVLVLRYDCDETTRAIELPRTNGLRAVMRQLLNANGLKRPNRLSSIIVKCSIVLFAFCTMLLCVALNALQFHTADALIVAALVSTVAALLAVLCVIVRQPVAEVVAVFRVPLVPWIPCLSVVINLYLMFQLDLATWIRFLVWGAIGKKQSVTMNEKKCLILYNFANKGYAIYFMYGIRNSNEGNLQLKEREAQQSAAKHDQTASGSIVYGMSTLSNGKHPRPSSSQIATGAISS